MALSYEQLMKSAEKKKAAKEKGRLNFPNEGKRMSAAAMEKERQRLMRVAKEKKAVWERKKIAASPPASTVETAPAVKEAHQKVSALEGEYDRAKSEFSKTQVGQPYAMGRDTYTPASSYAAGPQAKQMAEKKVSPSEQARAKMSSASTDLTAAKKSLFDVKQQTTAENYEKTAAHDDMLRGLAVDTTKSYLTGDAREAAARVRALQTASPLVGGTGEYGMYPQLEYLTDKQMETLLSLAGKEDWDGAGKYWKAIERSLNAQNQKTQSQEVKDFAEEHPVAGAAINVGAGFAQPLAYGANAVQMVKNAITGEYEPTDYNSGWFIGAHVAQDTAEGVHTAAEKAGGGVGAFAADTALSVANMGAKMLTGPASLPLMGLSAAGDNALDALERGATPGQAFLTSTAAGAAEILTEKLPVDDLLRMAKTAPKSAKEFVKNILKTMGSEGLQEVATEISNNLVDQMVMVDQSQYEIYVRELMDRGVDEDSARRTATLQFYLKNIGMAFLGGAAAGGVMGGISQGIGYAQSRAENAATTKGKYRTVKPQNVKTPAVPLIDLSTQDIPGVKGALPQTGNTLRSGAITRARNRLGLDQRPAAYIPASNVMRDGQEYVLKVTPSSLKKMLSPKDGGTVPVESIIVMDNLERIANNGVWFDSQGDRKGRGQIAGFDHLKTSVYIDGVPYEVDMRVRLVEVEPGGGADNVLYYYTPEEVVSIKKVGADTPTSGRRASSSLSESAPTSDPIIPSPGDGVNPEYAPGSGEDILAQTAQEVAGDGTFPTEQLDLDPTTQRIQQEVIQDTLHGVDEDTAAQLRQTAEEMSGAATQSMEAVQAQKTTAQTDGGRYSLKEFGDGRRFVDVDTDQSQFDGLTLREQGRLATKVIKKKFAGKVIGLDNRAYVNGRTAGEYGFPLNQLPPDIHEAKMRASTELDNLLDAGTNFRMEADGKDGHTHSKAIGDFRYFDTVFKVGEEYYSGVVNIMPVAKGLLLKDITKIENITQDISSSYGETPKSTFLRDASMDSISQPGGKSNSDFSLKTGEDILTQTAQQMDEAGKQGWRKHNEEAIKNAAATFGEHGGKLLQEFYRNSDLASDEYYGGFAAYYQAGLTGQDLTPVKSEYAQNLNPAQAEAAYLAGQLDAAASLEAEVKAAGYAPVAGTDAGLVADDYVRANLGSKTYQQLNAVCKALGVRARFMDGGEVLSGKGNAQIKGSEVLIAKDHQHPVRFVLGHELTHRIQQLAPEAYRTFRNFVAQDETVRNDIAYKLRSYGEKGVELDYEGALDEAVADYAGGLLEDGRMMDEFIQRHRTDKTLLEKLRDAIHALVNKLTGNEKKQAQTAEGKLAAALDAAAEQADTLTKQGGGQETAVTEDGGARYALKGVREDGIEVYESDPEVLKLSRKERMARFLTLMEDEYIGRTAKFVMNGEVLYAKFESEDIRKNIYGDKKSDRAGWNAKINAGASGDIFDLVENAEYKSTDTEKGKTTKAHRGVLGWEYFVKTVQIDGKVFDLLANVRKKSEGEYVYSIQLRQK